MLLFTPDRQITPDDPPPYEREVNRCSSCNSPNYEDEMFTDKIGENWICSGCLESSKQNELNHCEPGEEKGIKEYYDKLISKTK